jgi:intracellular sulfur oxidation DsrE/DsrF family protein
MFKKIRRTFMFLVPGLLLISNLLHAGNHPVSINNVLAEKEEPVGVVIEIVTGDSDSLQWALPRAKEYIARLKKRFPEIHVAIVTHGSEQFALTKDNQASNKKVHSLTQALRKDGVSLHVCGTYAEWKGFAAEDFPEYVDVSAEGPAQINDYKAVGYSHIVIRNED